MGAGGNMYDSTAKHEQHENLLKRAPTSKPPFTLSEIKKAIPPHCFQRSLIRSFSYVARDLILISIFSYIANTYFHLLPSPYCYLAWPTYWIVQGCACTALWLIGHECGHRAFSDYQWIDDTVGFIVHSMLFTPYFSWKYSHRLHHINTGTLDDEVHTPVIKSNLRWFSKSMNNPLARLSLIAILVTIGWPLYMTFNVLGRSYDSFTSHYHPYSPIYNDRQRLQIFLSDAGVLASTYVWYRVALTQGLAWVICIYVVPALIGNGIIVLIAYMNHTHSSLPHYEHSEWDWLRGALSTADRDCGMLNEVFHNGTNTHVMHHLFPSMPHYNAKEATRAVKPLLGEYYRLDSGPFYKSLWRDLKECIYVEKEEGSQGVYWYKSFEG